MATLNSQLANLKPFNGTNFSNWEFRLKIFLEQHNALNVLEQNAPTGEQQLQQFKKDDAKARNIMVQWLADDVLEMVKDKKTAKDMFETLKYTYTRRGLSMQVDLQRKLRNMKYKEGNLSDFFLEFDKIVSDLKASGGNLEEPEIICQLLAAMPENYQALTTSIDLMFSTNPKDVTVQFVKNKLLQEEIRQGNNGDQQKESVAFTSKYRGNGNRGNFQKRGNRQIRGQEKPKFNFKCYKCGKHGHKRNECRSSANVANGEDSRDEEISFIANKNDRTVTDETLMFIIDSGATNHLVNKQTKVYLSNIKPVSCQINVAKKGSVVNVTRSGNLHVTDKNGRNFNLKDVLQSDDLEYNLLSVKRIEKEGFKVIFEDGKVRICRKGNDTIVLEGNLKGNLYVVCFNPRFDCLNIAVDQDLLHRRMGHSSKYPPTSLCEVCLKAKQTRTHFKSMTDERKPKRVLEVISSDVCGPISPQTRDNMKYYIAVVQKQVFDFLGFLWIPILVNFFEIIFIILGFFGGYQNRAKYILSYLFWQVIWIVWNVFIICLYLDLGDLDHKTNKVLKLDSNSESWWRTEGPQCKTRMGPESSPEIESPPEVENCLFNYVDVEVFQCSLQIVLVVLGILFGINLIRIISSDEDDSFSDKSSRKRNRTSLYSIEFSTDLDNRHDDYSQDFNHLQPAMSPKPMTPRKVKRRSVMTRGSSTRNSTTSKRHSGSRSSTRSSRRSLQNPINYLMEQQKSLSTFERSQRLEPPVPAPLHVSDNNLGAYSHANLTYQQSSTQSLNKMDDLDELYTGRPASVRSSYSNFHGTRDFNYTNTNPYQHSHATPQVPQKKQKIRNSPMFLNNGPPAYSQRIYSNDSETTM